MPLILVNHLEAHSLVARMSEPSLSFPYLTLLISGGNSQLWVAEGIGDYRLLGSTGDDAIGEAFDKVARLLDIEMGPTECFGAALERHAKNGTPGAFQLPVPMRGKGRCSFSFAGLKSAARRLILSLPSPLSPQTKADVCLAFQQAAVNVKLYIQSVLGTV